MTSPKHRKALEAFCDLLSERKVAAKLTPAETEEEGDILTIRFPDDLNGKELFADLFFVPVSSEGEEVSMFSLRVELADLSGMEEEKLVPFLTRLCVLNDSLPLGGYGAEATDGDLPLKTLVYSASAPWAASLSGERLIRLMDETVSLAAGIVYETAGDLVG